MARRGNMWFTVRRIMARTRESQPERSAVAQRLQEMRERAGMSIRAVADELKCAPMTYRHYEDRFKRESLPVDIVRALIPLFAPRGIPPAELWSLAGLDNVADPGAPDKRVPLLSWVQAGAMAEVDPHTLERAEEHVWIADRRDTLFALRVVGHSMNQVAPHGSVIFVDYSDRDLVDGKLYVFRADDRATFKRYRANAPRLVPDSDDPEYTEIPLTQETQVVGRVVKITRDY